MVAFSPCLALCLLLAAAAPVSTSAVALEHAGRKPPPKRSPHDSLIPDFEPGTGNHAVLNRERRWIQAESEKALATAVGLNREREAFQTKELQAAVSSVMMNSTLQTKLEQYTSEAKSHMVDTVANYMATCKIAAQVFVKAVADISDDDKGRIQEEAGWQMLKDAFEQMFEQIHEADTLLQHTRQIFRTNLEAQMPKRLLPTAVPILAPPSDGRPMMSFTATFFYHPDVLQNGCTEFATSLKDTAFEFGGAVAKKLQALDTDAYSVERASGAFTAMRDLLKISYAEALGEQQAAHVVISTVAPLIATKLNCASLRHQLEGTKWWVSSD